MVPGHPPCALISLIFSSLDPETNCSFRFVVVCSGFQSLSAPPPFPITPFRNWPFFESLSVQLSRYSSLSFSSKPQFSLAFRLTNPENDTEPIPQVSTDFSLTLCVFCQPTFSVFDLHFHFRFHAFAVSDSSLRKVPSPLPVSRFLVQLSASFSLSDRP